jgi:hypothetical protein
MSDDFRAMAAGLRAQHEADVAARRANEAQGRDERHKEVTRQAQILRATVLPILARAKTEIGEEGIPSELKEIFDPATGVQAAVSLRFVGPKLASADGRAIEPRSKILFFTVEEDRVEAKIGKSYFAHRDYETDCSGSRKIDAADMEPWIASKVREILESYFANGGGKNV